MSGINAQAVFQRVAVQHARRRALRVGRHVRQLAFKRGRRGQQVGFGRVHPPGVDALRENIRVDLRPEELARVGIEGIVKGVRLVDPVLDVFGQVGLVEIAFGLHLFGVFRIGIELAPDRDHQMRVGGVDGAGPAFGIGKARGIELMRAPGVRLPILPILHDVVEGNFALAELLDDVERLLRGLIALARLPEPEGPVGRYRSFAGEQTVASDDLVDRRSVDELVVDAVANLGPKRGVRIGRRSLPAELQNVLLLGIVFDADGQLLPRREMDAHLIVPGQPVLAPVIHRQLAVEPDANAAVRVSLKLVVAGRRSQNRSFPVLLLSAPGLFHAFGMIDFGLVQPEMKNEIGAFAHRLGTVVGGDCEAASLTVGVKQIDRGNRSKGMQIAEARIGGVLPQDSVTPRGNQKRRHDVGVVLPQIEVVALDVDDAQLHLSQAVE